MRTRTIQYQIRRWYARQARRVRRGVSGRPWPAHLERLVAPNRSIRRFELNEPRRERERLAAIAQKEAAAAAARREAEIANRVMELDGSWWFADETEDTVGPYPDKDTAIKAYDAYCRMMLGDEETEAK